MRGRSRHLLALISSTSPPPPQVGNASSTTGAMSLHVYAPGWQSVRTYDEEVERDASGVPIDLDGWGDF